MALIHCADCGRVVSDLAVSCPDCARPIAMFAREGYAVGQQVEPARRASLLQSVGAGRKDGPSMAGRTKSAQTGADPTKRLALALKSADAERERPDVTSKMCTACGIDVRADLFREKRADGRYFCAECGIEEEERVRAARQVLARVGKVFALLVLFVTVITLSLYGMSQSTAVRRK